MVGHRWGAHDQYERLVGLLSEWLAERTDWVNWSIPRTNPVPTDGSQAAIEAAVDGRLRALGHRRGVLLVAARAGISFSEICRHEIRGARLIGVPVVVARPMEVKGSTFASERADRVCSWRGEIVARAIAEVGGRPDLLTKIDRLAQIRARSQPTPPALAAYAFASSNEQLRRELRRRLASGIATSELLR